MVAWAYDSYCTDNVSDTIEEYNLDKDNCNMVIEDLFEQILQDYPTENDLEFLIGIIIWCLKNNYYVKKNYLETSKELLKFLINLGDFKDWNNIDKRKKKLKSEMKIIKNAINNIFEEKFLLKVKNNNIVNKYA